MRVANNPDMATATEMPRNIDPKLTECYLLALADVLDASVFWCDGDLRACVTVHDGANYSEKGLQALCLTDLGIHQTPRAVTLIGAARRPNQSSSSSSSSTSMLLTSPFSTRAAA